MLLIIGINFSKFGVYSKSVTKSLYGTFLVSEGIFKLVCYCEKCRWSDISCVQGILVKNVWPDCWIVTVAYLKSSHQRPSVKKGALKNFANFTGKPLCWTLFSITLQAWGPATFLKRDSNTGVFPVKFPKLFRKKYLWT